MKPIDFNDLPKDIQETIARVIAKSIRNNPKRTPGVNIFDISDDITDDITSDSMFDKTQAIKDMLHKHGHTGGSDCPSCQRGKYSPDYMKTKEAKDAQTKEIRRITKLVMDLIDKETKNDSLLTGNVILWLLGDHPYRQAKAELAKAKGKKFEEAKFNRITPMALMEFATEVVTTSGAIVELANTLQKAQQSLDDLEKLDKKVTEIEDKNGNAN